MSGLEALPKGSSGADPGKDLPADLFEDGERGDMTQRASTEKNTNSTRESPAMEGKDPTLDVDAFEEVAFDDTEEVKQSSRHENEAGNTKEKRESAEECQRRSEIEEQLQMKTQEKAGEKVRKAAKAASNQADKEIADREKETGRPATVQEKAEIRSEVYGETAQEKEQEVIAGAAKEAPPDDRKALELILSDGELSALYAKLLPLIEQKQAPGHIKEEVREILLSKARLKAESLENEGDRKLVERFIAKLEQEGNPEVEKLYQGFLGSKQLEAYAQMLMLKRLQIVAQLDREKPGPYTDKNGRTWESRSELARAILNGDYEYESEEEKKTVANKPAIQQLPQLDSLLKDLGKNEVQLQKLNKEYEGASDVSVRVAVEEQMRSYDKGIAELKEKIAQATLGASLTAAGLLTLSELVRPDVNMTDVANEIVSNGDIKEHDGGRILEGKTKSGEPVFIERQGMKPVVFFTETKTLDGKHFIAKRTEPVAIGVNQAQLLTIAHRKGSEVFMKYPQLLDPIMRAIETGPDPELFLDDHNVSDAENVMVMLGGTKEQPKDGVKLLVELGVTDPDGTLLNVKPLIAFGNWLRNLTGGDNFEGVRQVITDENIRNLADFWRENGYQTDIPLEELRAMETM